MFEWNLFRQNDLVGRALKAREDGIREEDAERNKEREEMANLIRDKARTKLSIEVVEARVVSHRVGRVGQGAEYKRLNLEIDHRRGPSRLSQVTIRCAYHRKVGGGTHSGFDWAIGRRIPLWRRITDGFKHWWNHDWGRPFSKRVEWLPFSNLQDLGEIIYDERYFERFNIPDSAKFQGHKLTWNADDKS